MAKLINQYWADRQLKDFAEGEKAALELSKKLKENYDKAIAEIQKEINAFYGKFAREQGITIQQAKKLLDKAQLKSFKAQLDDYIDYAKSNSFDKNYMNELTLLKYRTNVSRLEELKTNIKFQVAKLTTKNQNEILDQLLESYDYSYLHTIFNLSKDVGLSFSFVRPATNVITKYLAQNINVGNYAIGENQIWEYQIPKLLNLLNTKIPQGIVLGQNPNKVAAQASKILNTDLNNTVRLVRTEYNYIFNEATFDGYKECGIPQYQILATLDERTCDSCGPLDLVVVRLADKEVGVNSPPFHPNCRCTTIPYFEPDEFDKNSERIAKDKNGKPYMVPSNLTYNEWKAGLTEHEGGVIYYKKS